MRSTRIVRIKRCQLNRWKQKIFTRSDFEKAIWEIPSPKSCAAKLRSLDILSGHEILDESDEFTMKQGDD